VASFCLWIHQLVGERLVPIVDGLHRRLDELGALTPLRVHGSPPVASQQEVEDAAKERQHEQQHEPCERLFRLLVVHDDEDEDRDPVQDQPYRPDHAPDVE
jgi:hypothetical protein